MEMIIEGQELQVFDLVACYAQRYQKTLIYFDLITYNALDATKKATVTAFYADFVDDYVMDIIKQGKFNTLQFDEENIASLMAGSWFPKESECPDSDHFIHAYVVDAYGDIIWDNA
jgi:hypothetical protein